MKVPLIWLSRHEGIDAIGPWDTGLIQRMFEGRLWPTTLEFESTWKTEREVPKYDILGPGVIVVPSRHHYDDTEWLNEQMARFWSVILVLSSDEDAKFPWKNLRHRDMKLWVQSPDSRNYSDCPWMFPFGYGWRYEFPDWARMARTYEPRSQNWSFAGQVTNPARARAVRGLRHAQRRVPGTLMETKGFSQGVEGSRYAEIMADSWIAPCPAGPMTPDTFRLYEALESGCTPIVDHSMPDGSMMHYWLSAGPQTHPFLAANDWDGVGGLMEMVLKHRHRFSAAYSAQWQQTKRAMVKRLESDLRQMGVEIEPWTQTTAVVTASPLVSHPSTHIIKETLESLPNDVEVVVAFDGIRPEQLGMAEAYDEFIYEMTMWCEHDHRAAIPVISPHWVHQVGTTRMAMQHVDTPAVLFVEHDTPLVEDLPIDWEGCTDLVANGHLDVLRFHHESKILHVHEYLMIDHQTRSMLGVPLRRTKQWSQRPALYNTRYLNHVLGRYFSDEARCFIEDRMHSVAQNSKRGHRLAIYHPEGNIQRSYHLDGRAGGPKYDDRQIF